MTCERHGGNAGSIMCRECDLETIERDAMTTPTPMTSNPTVQKWMNGALEADDCIAQLASDLAAAQEARDMHFARVRSLTLDLSDAVGRYQRAEALAESLKADAERLAYLRSIAYRSYVGERRGDYWFLTALCADGGGADFIAAIDAERGKE